VGAVESRVGALQYGVDLVRARVRVRVGVKVRARARARARARVRVRVRVRVRARVRVRVGLGSGLGSSRESTRLWLSAEMRAASSTSAGRSRRISPRAARSPALSADE